MTSRKAFRVFCALLAICIFQVYVMADATRPNVATANPTMNGLILGRLMIGESQTILVNGNNANSGTTILSGSQIQTPDGVEATVQLGSAGKLYIQPNSDLVVTFDSQSVEVKLASGDAFVAANAGVKSSVTTPDGKTAVSSGDPGSPTAPTPGWHNWSHGQRTAFVVVIIALAIFIPVCIAKCGGNNSTSR